MSKGYLCCLFIALRAVPLPGQAPPGTFVNFEGAQTNPIRISADGRRVFAVNTPNATVSVFDLAQPSSPKLIAEVPVGMEPVSVNINPNVAGNDEAWVVNQESDSVSVISVSRGIVTDTLYAKDEPSDVVFAGAGLAFVSIARSNCVNVYSTTTHALVKSIPLTGEQPRALAVSPKGDTVYVAFALSGNHSTIIPDTLAPPQPPPVNPALPPPPQVGLIVDASDSSWTRVIEYTMPDNDVAAIDSSSLSVLRYYPHLGTINLGLAVQPGTGNLYVANTQALNLVRFVTNLDGHIVNHRITSVNVKSGASQVWDLNPGIDYLQLPNPTALASALAMPTAIVFEPSGRYLYIAAFGTDRVGIFDTNTGTVSGFVEIDPQATGATVNPVSKRGPRGLALNVSAHLLYVLNRIYNTISIVNLSNNTVTAEIPTGTVDPTPVAIRNGRGFLYDHKLSGNGTGACASCHVDAEMDMLAWDLGDPTGDMTTLQQGNQTFQFHPMKGPMTTQSLRGLLNAEPYHWRGDKPDLAAFNSTFSALLGGSQLSDADMAALAAFINTIVYQPNPCRNLDNSMPSSVPLPDVPGASADPNTGENLFLTVPDSSGPTTCSGCHTAVPGIGSNLQVRLPGGHEPADAKQPLKVTQLRDLYQKVGADFASGAVSVNGFGYNHDGQIGTLYSFVGPNFSSFSSSPADKRAIEAFELCFDTGMPPAVGYSRTLTSATVGTSPAQSDWATLQSQAAAGNIDLIANGTVHGQVHGLLFQPANNIYQSDTPGLGPFTQGQLTAFIQAGDTLTIMGAPFGSGSRMINERTAPGAQPLGFGEHR